jgi:hypothetical protein
MGSRDGNRRRIGRALLLAAALFAIAGTAAAQTGGIDVAVVDATGAPLPGAVVTITNDIGYVKPTAVVSDKAGRALFPVLRPGIGYAVQVRFPGYSPIRHADLRVRLNFTLPLVVTMIDEVHEQVKVIAEAETISLEKSESSTRFSDEFISDLPVSGRFYTNILTMAPGVLDADGDGNPNVHGSRSRDFKAVVGGVSHVDPLTGQNFGRINLNSIEEMEVITAGAGVEFGRAQGGFARIIQKQGSNRHEGIVEFYLRTSRLDGDGAEDNSAAPDPGFESHQPGFQFSGPILRDRLWYRMSYERIEDELPVNVLSGIQIVDQARETQDAQLTWQVSPRNKLSFQFRGDPEQVSNFGVSNLVPPESSRRRERNVDNWVVNWIAPQSPRVLIESTLGWQEVNIFSGPSRAGVRNDCVPNAKEAFLSRAYCQDLTNNAISGSWFRTHDDYRQRFTVKSRATIYGGRFWGTSHQFKLGFSVENERYFRYLEERGAITYEVISLLDPGEDTGEEEDDPFSAFGLVTGRISVPDRDDVRGTGTNWAFYAEDQFKPMRNLTVTLGARFDREEINSEGREQFDPAAELRAYTAHAGSPEYDDDWFRFFTGYENIGGFKGQLVETLCEADGEQPVDNSCAILVQEQVLSQSTDDLIHKRKSEGVDIRNDNLSPFISFAWSPWANGKTAIKASAGRYYNNIPLMIPLQELNPVVTNARYRASLIDPDNCPEIGDPDAPVPCGRAKIVGGIQPLLSVMSVARDLRTPYQDELTFKIERELWRETTASLTYIARRFRDQIQDVNVNVGSADLGRCRRQTEVGVSPFVESPGTTLGLCSGSLTVCGGSSDCPVGESCGHDYYLTDPVEFCEITGDCLANEFSYPDYACRTGIDPYCGLPYPDSNPGAGDGFIDPVTGFVDTDHDGFADDNCVGETERLGEACGTDPFCDSVGFLRRPDKVTDLYLQNPFWGPIYQIGNYNRIDYNAWVLELVRRQYRSWEMNGSYTWSEAKGDGEDFFQELGDDPTLSASVQGLQSYDQTHVVKFNATTITPWGVRLGTSVLWQSGLPYSILLEESSFDTLPPVTHAFAGPGARPRRIYPTGVRNDQRNRSFWNVDLKATRELRLGRRANLQLSAELFNLLDDGTYQIYNPFFQRGVQVNGVNEAQRRFGRRWQVGMKLAF